MTLPFQIRKKNQAYDENIKKRGNVAKSLDPKRNDLLLQEARAKRDKQLGKKTRASMTRTQKTLVVVILVLFLASVFFQFIEPFFLSRNVAPKKKPTPKGKVVPISIPIPRPSSDPENGNNPLANSKKPAVQSKNPARANEQDLENNEESLLKPQI
ncbi:hypothetical protein BB560_006251 [Smittium megazygosporum]|uniref:Uncharacterized protein n=1 Tax=Smittium megazygosporum TaxID=133381 RepID=A0A2T9YCF0_9FUNG|nr:hypothetical protein BB560_006251 [Smittium megazygosporum]